MKGKGFLFYNYRIRLFFGLQFHQYAHLKIKLHKTNDSMYEMLGKRKQFPQTYFKDDYSDKF